MMDMIGLVWILGMMKLCAGFVAVRVSVAYDIWPSMAYDPLHATRYFASVRW